MARRSPHFSRRNPDERRCACPAGLVRGDCPLGYANWAHGEGGRVSFGLTEDEFQALGRCDHGHLLGRDHGSCPDCGGREWAKLLELDCGATDAILAKNVTALEAEARGRTRENPVGDDPADEQVLNVGYWIDKTEVEGPGVRFALWVKGCAVRCAFCCNPDLFSTKAGNLMTVRQVFEKIQAAKAKYPKIEGVTFLGGEPMEQVVPLAQLAKRVREAGLTVCLFTSYEFDAVKDSPIFPYVDLLKTGRFEKDLYTTKLRWIGSTNQKFWGLPREDGTVVYDPETDPRFKEPNAAEVHYAGGEIQVSGFPFPKVVEQFKRGRKIGDD